MLFSSDTSLNLIKILAYTLFPSIKGQARRSPSNGIPTINSSYPADANNPTISN